MAITQCWESRANWKSSKTKPRSATNSGQQRAKIEQRLAAVQRELDRTIGLVVKGIVSEDEAAAQLPPLRAEKAELEAELKTVGEPVKVVEAIQEYILTVDLLEAALQSEAGDEHPAVEPVRKLIDRVILPPAENGPLHIRVKGKLNSLVGGQYPAMSLGGLLVAEEGFEPPTHGL